MKVYVALQSSPDYHAGSPAFMGVSETLAGAAAILYPNRENPGTLFRVSHYNTQWDGPDGFGLIKLVEVKP